MHTVDPFLTSHEIFLQEIRDHEEFRRRHARDRLLCHARSHLTSHDDDCSSIRTRILCAVDANATLPIPAPSSEQSVIIEERHDWPGYDASSEEKCKVILVVLFLIL